MVEPKTFYRKLDLLLAKIGKEKTGSNFLFTILKELENSFAQDLHFANARLYAEAGDYFELVAPVERSETSPIVTQIPIDSEAMQLLLKNGSYIYDDSKLRTDFGGSNQGEYEIPAGFTVQRSLEDRWVVIFELHAGWVREEIEFCMNAVRSAVNHRLYTDAVKSDMQQAAHIQRSLLPAAPLQIFGFQMAGRSQPAELVGGDMFDYFQFSDGVFGVSIGDASGHGLPAALLVRDVVTGLRMGLEEEMKMVHTLKKLNRVIQRSTYSTRFISLFYGEIENNGNIIYVNAGHPSPLLIQGDQVTELKSTGMILGAMPEIALYRSYAKFTAGAALVMFSDGIIERKNSEREEFGMDRLIALAKEHQERSAQEILDIVFNTVFEFGEKMKWSDDATVVVIRRLPKSTTETAATLPIA